MLANAYLTPVDRVGEAHIGSAGYVRYMDDMRLFGDLGVVREGRAVFGEAVEALGLELKPSATQIGACWVGVPFLGVRLWPAVRRFDRSRAARWRRKMRAANDERDLQVVESLLAWAAQSAGEGFARSWVQRRKKLHRPDRGE